MKELIFIYGAGNMGLAALHILKSRGIEVSNIIDGNEKKHGQMIEDIRIVSMDAIPMDHRKNVHIIVAVSAVPFQKLFSVLQEKGYEYITPAGDYLKQIIGKPIVNVWNMESSAANLLVSEADKYFKEDISLKNWRAAVGWFEGRDEAKYIDVLPVLDREKYFPAFLVDKLAGCKTMLDISFLDGEYTQKFLQLNNQGTVYAFQLTPNSEIRKQDKEIWRDNVFIMNEELYSEAGKHKLKRIGIMDPFTKDAEYVTNCTTIDEYFSSIKVDFVRGYSMEPILPILKNGLSMIFRDRPIIAFNISHYKSDFENIFSFLETMKEVYSFKFRLHSYQGNDCIVYAIPKEDK